MKITIRRQYETQKTEQVSLEMLKRTSEEGFKTGDGAFVHANLTEPYMDGGVLDAKVTPVFVFENDNAPEAWGKVTEKQQSLRDWLYANTPLPVSGPVLSARHRFVGELMERIKVHREKNRRRLRSKNDKTADEIKLAMYQDLCERGMDGHRLALALMEISFLKALGRDKRRTLKRTHAAIEKAERMIARLPKSPYYGPQYDCTLQALRGFSETLWGTIHQWSHVRQPGKRGYKPETPILIALAKYAEEQTGEDQCHALSVLTGYEEDTLGMLLKRAKERPELQNGWRDRIPGESVHRRPRDRKAHAPGVRRVLGAGPFKGLKHPAPSA